MKFVSAREFRNRPGRVQALARKDDLVLTAKGVPIAFLIPVEGSDLEETSRAIRQVRAQRALARIRRQAAQRGLDRIPASAIEVEIRSVRSKRKPR